jgi:tetratricopeptide (TPR) repeat protein
LLDLEPDRPNALVHLARIEAAARDAAALDSVARRVIELAPSGDRVLEMRLLQALVRNDGVARERVIADFRQANDDAIALGVWSAGTYLEDPDAAASLARLLVENSRSSDTRVIGYGILASVAMVEGRWSRAVEALDAMAVLNPIAALEHRTMMTATAIAPLDSASLEAYRDELRAVDWAAIPKAAAAGVWATALDGLHRQLGQYLIGLASARRGDEQEALAAAEALERLGTPPGYGSLVRDWARGVRATMAWQLGRVDDALREIDGFEGRVWYQFATASPFLTLAYERYLLARLLEETGRLEDALRWYGSFEATALHELAFLAPSHWRRGIILQQLGDGDTARAHFDRALELWHDADAEFRPVVEDARERLDRR